MASTPHIRHARYGHFARQRYSRRLLSFLSATGTRLLGSASAQTIVPVHVNNVDATDVLTMGTKPSAAQTVTINDRVYTFKTALTEAKAARTLTNDGTNVTDLDTVTIGSTVYTFQNTLTNVAGNVHIGASNTATMTNLFNAINRVAGTPGTDYAAATVPNTQVIATNPTGTTVVVTALVPGVAANAIATTETSTHLAWGGTTLAGGVDPVANEVFIGAANTDCITNLVAAVNASGAGTLYSTSTVVNADVSLGARVGNTTTATAKAHGAAGNAVGVSTTVTAASWATDHLAGGVTETWGPNTTATSHGISEREGPYVITSSNGVTHVPAGYTVGDFLWAHVVDANTVKLYRDAGLTELQTFSGAGTGTISLTKASTNAGIYDLLKRNDARTIAAASDIDSLS